VRDVCGTQCNAELSAVLSADVLKTWVYEGLENVSGYISCATEMPGAEPMCLWSAGSKYIRSLDVKTRVQAGH
jgi:hypothetical protein